MKRDRSKTETEAIRSMIGHRLKTYVEIETMDAHPDEDMICAFIEGRLAEAASYEMVSHLIACGVCRQTTAQLARVDVQFDSGTVAPTEDDDASGLPQALKNLAARIIPTGEGDAVFAYQNPRELDDDEDSTASADSNQARSSESLPDDSAKTEPE